MAISGRVAGAYAANHEWGTVSGPPTSAVPVFPATGMLNPVKRWGAVPMDLVTDAVRSAQTQPLEETPFLEEFFAESFDPISPSP